MLAMCGQGCPEAERRLAGLPPPPTRPPTASFVFAPERLTNLTRVSGIPPVRLRSIASVLDLCAGPDAPLPQPHGPLHVRQRP